MPSVEACSGCFGQKNAMDRIGKAIPASQATMPLFLLAGQGGAHKMESPPSWEAPRQPSISLMAGMGCGDRLIPSWHSTGFESHILAPRKQTEVRVTETANLRRQVLCARPCLKCFRCINAFNP